MFNKIIKSKAGSFTGANIKEPRKPLRIIPGNSVVLRTAPASKRELSPKASGEIKQADQGKAVLTVSPSVEPEKKTESFDQDYVDDLLCRKAGELEEFYKNEIESAYQRGYQQGKSEGFAEGEKSLQPLEEFLDRINQEIKSSRNQLLRNAEEIMGRLSLEIAEAVIGEAAIKSSGELLEYNLKRCLDILSGSGIVTIKVNPSDYDTAKEKIDMVFAKNKDRFKFKFEPDSSITPGGCLIESPGGDIDGRIENQFNLIKENFLQMV